MGLGVKAPVPLDCAEWLERLVEAYHVWLRRTEASLPTGVKLRRTLSQLYRSKGERKQIADYYAADFTIEVDEGISPASRTTHADPCRGGDLLSLIPR
jgi:hypothetical protein